MENKKVVAIQVPPEEQDPCFEDGIFEGIEITGNKNFQDYTSGEFDRLVNALPNMGFPADDPDTPTKEILEDVGIVKQDKTPWTEEELSKWHKLLAGDIIDSHECISAYLTLITGHEWEHAILCGICQSDWQGCYYDTSTWTQASLEDLASRYFNTGTEWQIVDGEEEYYLYSTLYGEDNIRAEIADSAGVKPEDVEMHIFAGYKRIPQYQIA